LPTVVTLTTPVFDVLTANAGRGPARLRIEQELAELAADCGVAVRPEVRFASTPDPMRGQPLRVHVDGRLCLVPARRSAEALAYATHSPQVGASLTSEDLLDDSVHPAQLHETLATVARAAVSARPEVLVADGDPLAALLGSGLSLAGEDPETLGAAVRSGGAEALLDRLAAPTFDLHFEPEYLKALTTDRDAAELFTFLRDGMLVELGILLPPMRIRLDPTLRNRGFAFRVNAIRTIPRIGLDLDSIHVNDTPERLHGLDVSAVASVNPATGQPGAIAPAAPRTRIEAAGLTVWDAFGYHILVMADVIRTHAPALMSPAQVRAAMSELGKAFPAVTGSFDDTDIARVVGPLLRSLLAELISTRNLRHILQLVRRHAVAPEVSFGYDLPTFVRRGMVDQIGHVAARGTNTLVVYLLDPEFERELAEGADRAESVPLGLAEDLRDAFYGEIRHLPPTASLPAVLTTDKCRAAVRDTLCAEYPTVRVLDYQDLPAHYSVQPVARISR
jgi:hypothetical protein